MRKTVFLIALVPLNAASAEECAAPPQKGESVLLFVVGKDGASGPQTGRICVRREGNRREVRTLAPNHGYLRLTAADGRTVVETHYDRPDRRTVSEYSRPALDVFTVRPGEAVNVKVRATTLSGAIDMSIASRALRAREVRIGACTLPVIDIEHRTESGGKTQVTQTAFSPALGYSVTFEAGPWTSNPGVRTESVHAWSVVRIGSREEARKSCDDFTS